MSKESTNKRARRASAEKQAIKGLVKLATAAGIVIVILLLV